MGDAIWSPYPNPSATRPFRHSRWYIRSSHRTKSHDISNFHCFPTLDQPRWGLAIPNLMGPNFAENSRRLWLFWGIFLGVLEGNSRKSRENIGISSTGKANLPRTLGPHSPDLVPTFWAFFFLKSKVAAFSSFAAFCRHLNFSGKLCPKNLSRLVFGALNLSK